MTRTLETNWTEFLATLQRELRYPPRKLRGAPHMLADRRYCYPLTLTDFASCYLLCCEALHSTKEQYAFPLFERATQI